MILFFFQGWQESCLVSVSSFRGFNGISSGSPKHWCENKVLQWTFSGFCYRQALHKLKKKKFVLLNVMNVCPAQFHLQENCSKLSLSKFSGPVFHALKCNYKFKPVMFLLWFSLLPDQDRERSSLRLPCNTSESKNTYQCLFAILWEIVAPRDDEFN